MNNETEPTKYVKDINEFSNSGRVFEVVRTA